MAVGPVTTPSTAASSSSHAMLGTRCSEVVDASVWKLASGQTTNRLAEVSCRQASAAGAVFQLLSLSLSLSPKQRPSSILTGASKLAIACPISVGTR